ncbi:MAG: hypothetical protein ABIV94_09110 [Acidimicrobiales bacterium]
MAPQTKALQLALARYRDDAGRFDAQLWADAFASSEPRTINEVVEVVGGYVGLVNHILEMLRSGTKLAGLEGVHERPGVSIPEIIEAAREDGCFSEKQAETLKKLNRTRNRLQHNSPGVPADEVQERLELLMRTMPRLLSSYVDWMAERGFPLVAKRQ